MTQTDQTVVGKDRELVQYQKEFWEPPDIPKSQLGSKIILLWIF